MNDYNIIYVADFMFPQANGGAEQSDHELLFQLEKRGHSIKKIQSHLLSKNDIEENKESFWIVSNFINWTKEIHKEFEIIERFLKIEHDHQYLKTRNPCDYPDYKAPKSEIVNREFYKRASYVLVQSKLHQEILNKNLPNATTYCIGGNLWSDKLLDYLGSVPTPPQNGTVSIMVSNIKHKNTLGAIKYCQRMNMKYELIPSTEPKEFLRLLSKNEMFVFLPQTVESLSRIVAEAKMMNIKVITNNNIGAASEVWFKELKGGKLIEYMRDKKIEVVDFIETLV